MDNFRVYSVEFKVGVVQRALKGESVRRLCQELELSQASVYRWRASYCQKGMAGLRPYGRPPGSGLGAMAANPEEVAQRRIAKLERKIGQQALDLDFLQRAFKRVKESRQKNSGAGGTASTGRSNA